MLAKTRRKILAGIETVRKTNVRDRSIRLFAQLLRRVI